VEEEKGERGRMVHHSSKAERERYIEWEDGGRSDDVWLWALGSIICDTSDVRRLRQTTVRAHVILTQDAGRADYWTSPVSLF